MLAVQLQHHLDHHVVTAIATPHIFRRVRHAFVDHHAVGGVMDQRAPGQRRQQEIPVLVDDQVGLVAHARQHVAAVGHTAVGNAVQHEHAIVGDIGDRYRLAAAEQRRREHGAVFVLHLEVAEQQLRLVAQQALLEPGQMVGAEGVVIVEEQDVVAVGDRQPQVAAGSRSRRAAAAQHIIEALVEAGQLLVRRQVAGRVGDNHDLEVLASLRGQRLQRARQQQRPLVGRNDDGKHGLSGDRMLGQGSRIDSSSARVSGYSRYDITVRWPTTISADSVMPGSSRAPAVRFFSSPVYGIRLR